MASRQAKEESAEAAARLAADDLRDINQGREYEGTAMYKGERDVPQQQERPGVIGSVLRAVQGTYEHAKEAVVGKRHDTAEATRETTDTAGRKMDEYSEYATQKAKETKDYTAEEANQAAEKARETKDTVAGKDNDCAQKTEETTGSAMGKTGEYENQAAGEARETKDYTVEKAKEAKDATVQKAGEYKDYTAEKAREAKDTTMGKAGKYKDYAAEKATEGKDTAVGKLGVLKDSAAGAARKAMDFIAGKKEEAKQKTLETAEATKGTLKETGEAAGQKMEEMRMKEEKETSPRGVSGTRSKLVINLEDTPPRVVVATLKTSDQMTGQTFNDVGRFDDEGTVVVGKERQDKM